MKKALFAFVFLIILVSCISFASAWYFYGSAYDTDGNALYNATVNITIWSGGGGPPTYVGSNVSYSNQTGWFNFSVTGDSNWMYKPVIRHFEENRTDGNTPIDYVGQSLPQFPFTEFNGTTDINFYLREAGTINITAVNATGSPKTFQYQVKDTKLGYPIAEGFGTDVSSVTVYVPRDRNYTIQIYPNESMPVSYHWNNFSSENDLNISTPSNDINLSSYNATTHTLHKQFNCSENLVWVSGNITNSTGGSLIWNEFTVVPFILEAGSMVYLGSNAAMPYNMSAWRISDGTQINETNAYINETSYQLSNNGFGYTLTAIWGEENGEYNVSVGLDNASVDGNGLVTNATTTTYDNVSLSYTYLVRNDSDQYTLATGFYNITLPGTAESTDYILFATARNGTDYYGGYRNISLNYSSSDEEFNFTMYKLMGTDWNTSTSNITMNDATTWQNINISTARQAFNLVNATTNATLTQMSAHIEVMVDYSNYNATEFTFMTDLSNADGTFYIPLIKIL